MAINKIVGSFDEAVADIADGAVLLIGGFAGPGECPSYLIAAVARKAVKDLTIVGNSGGWGPELIDMLRTRMASVLRFPPDFYDPGLLVGTSVLYWVTSPIVGVVEHDAYILTILYVIRDLGESQGINVWPYYWALVWAGTLGSNLTIAGAPALYVALTMGEKEDGEKFSLKEFFSYTVPYVISSLVLCYILLVLVWVLPFTR